MATAVNLAPFPKQQFNQLGIPLAGGKLFTYAAGTTNKLATFTDSTGTVQNTNPIILDANGQCDVWLQSGLNYKLVLSPPTDTDPPTNPFWTEDNVASVLSAAATTFDGVSLATQFLSRVNRVVDSISALRGLSKATYTRAFVTGYYGAGDGGGGPYWCDLTDTTSTDNGGSIIVASDGGRWKLVLGANISVKQFGAKGDGTTDDTAAFQSVVNFAKGSTVKTIYIPPAVSYCLTHVDLTGNAYSGITFEGFGGMPILKFTPTSGRQTIPGWGTPTYARTNAADGMFTLNAATGITTNDSSNVNDITFRGVQLQADIVNQGFDQLMHLIAATGVSRLTIDRCKLIGFLGDGLCVCRGLDNTTNQNAYNSDVRVRASYFDGVNQGQRNGISLYYCDGFDIVDNDFRNTTNSTMPGAIDIEPDNALTRTRNGRIENCRFYNIGGTGGAVTWHAADAAPYAQTSLEVAKCHFESVQAPLFAVTLFATNSSVNEPSNIWFHDNTVNNAVVSFDIRVRGVTIERNIFKNITTTTRSSGNNCQDVFIKNNLFDTVSYSGGVFFGAAATNVQFDGNTFYNMAGGGITSNTVGGVTKIRNNNFASSTTANSAPYSLAAGGPSAYGFIDLGGNTFGTNFVAGLSIYGLCNNNTEITKYSQLNPQNMPYGRNSFWSNGDYPTTGYGGSYTGQCVTFSDPNQTAIGGVVEVFYPSDDIVHFFVRRATGATTWGQWKDYVGTPTS